MYLRLGFVIAIAGLTFGIQCPFNTQECQCEPDQRKPPIFDFEKVNCSSPSNYNPPTFTPANGTKYSVNTFRIYGNVASLPAYYFIPFSEIRYLELVNSQYYPQQSWNALAFYYCNISALNASNLEGLFPPPAALLELGSSGLQQLSIGPVRNAVTLKDYQYANFTSLRSLTLSGVPITGISENAFVGLEKHLTSLHLVKISYQTSGILKAVVKLPGLTDLWLAGLGITDMPSGYFSAFPKLKSLWLAYDTLVNNTEGGYLYDLPSTLSSIGQINAGLTAVPKLVFARQQKQGLSLDLSSNAITVIGPNDFLNNVAYNELTLTDAKLTSIDLSLLPKDAKRIDFGNNKYLKSVTASSLEEVPRYAQLSINPALESIDPRLANSFVRYRDFSLDITNNQNMDCKNLVWITPYVFCWKTIRIQGSYCSTGQPVTDYLRNIGFNCTGN